MSTYRIPATAATRVQAITLRDRLGRPVLHLTAKTSRGLNAQQRRELANARFRLAVNGGYATA